MINQDDIRQQVVDKIGIKSASLAVQEAVVSQVGENIMTRVVTAIHGILPEEKRAEFETLIGAGDVDALNAFLKPHVPNLDILVQQEAEKEIAAYKEEVAKQST
ncbi:hypothetical protein A3D62_02925 [Candidatus Kaiserbacteria bacterium RIFCSPHIGHO2_02_FULL_49_11]|uniref:Uncharacterized protein n=1 Tax=Candidatus Kaiserbacteria bacterium RIFCSPHIGHO2_02_FULL_49_11 TaxID=1798489 RepID=A0A1F6D0J9_9BACT|nr:MAG: hypothetical protein A3D62_02925 [Candidatus Kaiserbacteria bacterium RIFCSPHIGHO2_02_FULL_49_11]